MSIAIKASVALQDIATTIVNKLRKATGQELGFVLIVSADFTAQYVSNCSRADGKVLIDSLLERWRERKADIPAHYNPDLAFPQETLQVACRALENANQIMPCPLYAEAITKIHDTLRKQGVQP